MPFASVVLPVRNGRKFVRDAVDSILGQSFRDLELIVVDDGSIDGTVDALSGVIDSRLTVIRHVDSGGISSALNAGIRLASGEVIVRHDADDISDRRRLDVQVEYLRSCPDVSVLGCDMRLLSAGRVVGSRRWPTRRGVLRYRSLFWPIAGHPTVVMRRSFIARCGLYASRQDGLEDFELWLRGSAAGCWYGNVPQRLVDYRLHDAQVTARSEGPRHLDMLPSLWQEHVPHEVAEPLRALLEPGRATRKTVLEVAAELVRVWCGGTIDTTVVAYDLARRVGVSPWFLGRLPSSRTLADGTDMMRVWWTR